MSTKMYKMRPIVDHGMKVQLPNCMYKMKDIHDGSKNGQEQGTGRNGGEKLGIIQQKAESMGEFTELQARQDVILQQLAQLKKQIDSIKGSLNISNVKQNCVKPALKIGDLPKEIVVFADPEAPIHSLELVQKLSAKSVSLEVTTYTHSSVSELCQKTKELNKRLSTFKPTTARKCKICLIWKKGLRDAEVVIGQSRILGEINLLRFFARFISHLRYESENPQEIDRILETTYLITTERFKGVRATLLQQLYRNLGKNEWFCGSKEATIADLAVFSTLKQVSSDEINVHLRKWLEKCSKLL